MLERFGYRNLVAAVYIAALFMQVMDGTIINVALPTLAEEFGVEPQSMDWTVLAFTIAMAVMTASAGWFGDRFGLRNVFVGCLGGFVAASALCGLSGSLGQLVAARGVQGAFAGMMAPVGSALLFRAFPIEERAAASRKVITVAVFAPALGPIVGGLILEVTSWRWIFFVNVPMGGLALALGWVWLQRDEPEEDVKTVFDMAGFFQLALGLSLFLYGLSRGGERGWGAAPILVSLLVGSGLLASFALTQLQEGREHPLLHLRLMAERNFRRCNAVALPTYAAFMAVIYLLPLFLQSEAGHGPLAVGLAMAPQPLGVLITSQFAGRGLYKTVGPRRLLIGGALSACLIGFALATIDTSTSLWTVRALMLARGCAMGLVFVPLQASIYARIEPAQLGRATPVFSTVRQVAPALGVALVSAVLGAGLSGTTVIADRVGAYRIALVVSAVLFAIAAGVAWRVDDDDSAATRGLAPTPVAPRQPAR